MGWRDELRNTVREQAILESRLRDEGREGEALFAAARRREAERKLAPKRVRCDTCGVRFVEVDQDFDGTEYVACAECLGDEAPATLVSARDVADDDAVHAAIDDRNDAWGLA
jgi:hypothetical protein